MKSQKAGLLLSKNLKSRCRERLRLLGVVKDHYTDEKYLRATVPGPALRAVGGCVITSGSYSDLVRR